MRSKLFTRLLSFTVFAALSLQLTSCKVEIGESINPNEGYKPPSKTECLNGAFELMSRYMDGGANASEVVGFWNCASDSVKLFQTRTWGVDRGVYLADHLRSFLQLYFLTDFKISDPLLMEAMALKQAVLGGSLTEFSNDEFEHTLILLTLIRDIAIDLLPYMPIDFSTAGKTPEQIEAFKNVLVKSAERLGEYFESHPLAYGFDHLKALLEAVLDVIPDTPARKSILNISRRIPLLIAAKRIFVSPKGILLLNGQTVDGLRRDEVKRMFVTGARAAIAAIHMSRLLESEDSWFVGREREGLVDAMREFRFLFLESMAQHPNQQVAFTEIENLITALKPGDLGRIQIQNAKDIVRPLFRGLLAGADFSTNGRQADGFTQPTLNRIWKLLEVWNEGQIILENAYKKLSRYSGDVHRLLPTAYGPSTLMSVLETMEYASTPELQDVHNEALAGIRLLVNEFRPLFNGTSDRILFSGGRAQLRIHSLHNLTQMNWLRLASVLMIEGYASTPERAANRAGLTFPEAKKVLVDIRKVLEDLRIVDPDAKGFEMSRFREMSLFTFASDGGDYVNLNEGIYYLAHAVSSANLGTVLYQDWKDECGIPGDYDFFGRNYLRPSCVKEHFARNYGLYIEEQMPQLYSYLENLKKTPGALEEFIRLLNLSGMLDPDVDDRTSSYMVEGYASTLHFMEVVFSRFDKNDSGKLTADEAREAFPVLRCTLNRYANSKTPLSPHMLESVLTYMLAFGHMPKENEKGDTTFWAKVGVGAWSLLPSWPIHADRSQILKIFAALSEMGTKASVMEAQRPTVDPSVPAIDEDARMFIDKPCTSVRDGGGEAN